MIFFYQDEDISKLMNKQDRLETLMYSTSMQMNLTECSGNLNMSCMIGSMSFNRSKNIQQCCKGYFFLQTYL